ncbi:MAG: prepilin peptidase [Patescibacteria group bacterium]|jgi:prepilin signal peptidase PulO-like enzyme (type II secretory pathway)|nr:prepilin peptidase [Patescibacteria group bacterium]
MFIGWIYLLLLFCLGLCLGSFANVLIDRTENGKSLDGRSKCDFCGYQLRWFDNIPIISFLILRAKCRKCHRKLSWQYPAVELFMGIVFAVSAWQLGMSQSFENPLMLVSNLLLMITAFLFVLVVVWDLKYMIIPNEIVIAGVVVTVLIFLIKFVVEPCTSFDWNCFWISGILGAIVMSGFFWMLYAISKGTWIGGGDVKLAIWLGLLVGIKMVYPALMIAYIVGAIVAIFLIIRGKKKMKSTLFS